MLSVESSPAVLPRGSKARLWVQKYGGTSVGSPERIKKVAQRIAQVRRSGVALVVVVSAMGDTTDELIDLANRVSSKPPQREMDMLLSAGERISMALTCMALADLQIPAVSFTGSQSGIITDASHRRARIQRITPYRIQEALEQGQVVIVAGFQGVSETKEITTLGRGGSDTTAVALAVALGAERCEIYTDVDGVYSADPRIVSDARFWPELPSDLMTEMAVRGAGVLHPRCVELARQHGLTLWVKNSLRETQQIQGTGDAGREQIEQGTIIRTLGSEQNVSTSLGRSPGDGGSPPGHQLASDFSSSSIMEKYAITGVSADSGKFAIQVNLARGSADGALWDGASQAKLLMLSVNVDGQSVRFFGEVDSKVEWARLLDQLISDGFATSYRFHEDQVPLSVVGLRFSQDGGALSEVLRVLRGIGVEASQVQGASLSVCVGVPRSKSQDCVVLLHRHFFK